MQRQHLKTTNIVFHRGRFVYGRVSVYASIRGWYVLFEISQYALNDTQNRSFMVFLFRFISLRFKFCFKIIIIMKTQQINAINKIFSLSPSPLL